ncbi:Carbonic AnHydrase [Chamberlinius hualienensis]
MDLKCFFSHLIWLIYVIKINRIISYYGDECIKEWHYVDEDEWCCNISSNCCGDNQSPVNIDTNRATYERNVDCLLLQNYGCVPEALTENNIEHTMQLLYYQGNKSQEAHVVYKGVKYIFDRAVFHFGENSSTGSEHTLNNVQFPLEMQLVHRNEKYATIEEAKNKSDGLLNIAVLFVTANTDNDDLRGIIYDMHYVMFKDDYYCVKPFPISMLLPRPYGYYYSYKGSMTVPPCYESVQWLVFHNPVPISEYQLDQFRKLQHNTNLTCPTAECPMWNNYRRKFCHKDRNVKWKEECNPISCPTSQDQVNLTDPDIKCCHQSYMDGS